MENSRIARVHSIPVKDYPVRCLRFALCRVQMRFLSVYHINMLGYVMQTSFGEELGEIYKSRLARGNADLLDAG